MKALLIAVAITAAALMSHAQGTIEFANGVLTRVRLYDQVYVPTNAWMTYGVFWSTSQDGPQTLVHPLGSTLTTLPDPKPGLIYGGASKTYAIPGTEPDQYVWLQVRGWEGRFGEDWQLAALEGWYGETDVRQVRLGPTAGPGTVIWQTVSGTNVSRFRPLFVPEPAGLVLGFLAIGIWFNRKRAG